MANQSITVTEGVQGGVVAVGLGAVYDPSTNTFIGVDSVSGLGLPTVADVSAADDALVMSAIIKTVADTALGAEVVSLLASIVSTNTGTGADSVSVLATLSAIADTAAGLDAVTILAALKAIADTGDGADLASILATVRPADAGAAADTARVLGSSSVADLAAGLDTILDVVKIHVYVRSDGVVDPLGVILLRGGRTDITPSVRENTEEIPGRPGQLDFGADIGPRGLEFHLASQGALSPAEIAALKRYVARWLGPTAGVFNVLWEDDPDRYLQVRVAGPIQPDEYGDYLEFVVPLKATQPMYLGSTLKSLTGSGTATSDGTEPTPAIVTIRGPVTNPAVTVAGVALSWTGTVGAADVLVVDAGRMTVTFNGINALSGFLGTFPVLQPGDNAITAAAAGVTTTTWRDRWI